MKKSLTIVLNIIADTLDTDTALAPFCTLANVAALKYDTTVLAYSKIASKLKNLLDKNIKTKCIDYHTFMPSLYIIDLKKMEEYVKSTISSDVVLVWCGDMKMPSLMQTHLQKFSNKNIVHIRMASITRSYFRMLLAKFALEAAKETAIYRLFDYCEVCDFNLLTGRDVKVLGLYEEPSFKHNGKTIPIHYCPDIDYHKFVVDKPAIPTKKVRLFTFGYNSGSYRTNELDKFCYDKIVDDPKSKCFVYRKCDTYGKKINSLVPVKKYYAALALSKFTFNIPSTLATQVSVLRVNEALRRDCISLFKSDVAVDKAYSKEDAQWIRSNLMFDERKHKTVNDFAKELEPKYEDLLKQFKNLDFARKGFNLKSEDILKEI